MFHRLRQQGQFTGSKIFPVGWSGLEEVKNLSFCHRADTHHRGFYRWRFLKIVHSTYGNTHPQHAIPVVITVTGTLTVTCGSVLLACSGCEVTSVPRGDDFLVVNGR